MHSFESTPTLAMGACPRLPHSYDEVEQWLVDAFARLSDLDSMEIDVERAFVDYQLDSSAAVTLAQQLGRWGQAELQATIFWEFPNIRQLARALALDGEEVGCDDAS